MVGSDLDRALVERQLGRPPRAFRRVAVRCPFGRPAVTEQAPFDNAGEPFPTTFWLTCPHLVAAVSRLEAAGGVDRWSRAAADDPELRAQAVGGDAVAREVAEAAIAVFPLAAHDVQHNCHPRASIPHGVQQTSGQSGSTSATTRSPSS